MNKSNSMKNNQMVVCHIAICCLIESQPAEKGQRKSKNEWGRGLRRVQGGHGGCGDPNSNSCSKPNGDRHTPTRMFRFVRNFALKGFLLAAGLLQKLLRLIVFAVLCFKSGVGTLAGAMKPRLEGDAGAMKGS